MVDVKREMKEKTRLAKGLVNSLDIDVDYLCMDVDSNDILCIGSSIHETKVTLGQLLDTMTELEQLLYLIKKG